MSETSPRALETDRPGNALFVALVIASYVMTFGGGLEGPTPLKIGALIAGGVVYTLVGIYLGAYCERLGSPRAAAAYFAIQVPLGTAILYLSESNAWLLMLPLVGQAVPWLPRRWAAVVCACVWVGMVAAFALFVSSGVDAEGERLYPPGSGRFLLIVLQIALAYLMAVLFVVLFTWVAAREREARAEVERLAGELQDANRQLREYAAQVEELATLRERNRLAREIHDGLGHYLTAINMQIQAGRAVLEHDPSVALDALAQAQELAQEGLSEVRRSVSALRASPLDGRSLSEAIGEFVDECRAAGVATDYVVRGEARALYPQAELTLYRVAQEGLTNVRKHAQASSAEVVLDYGEGEVVRLVVRDSGVGSEDPTGGYGLVGVRERVQLLGGEMRVETAPGEGFALMVEVPAEGRKPGL